MHRSLLLAIPLLLASLAAPALAQPGPPGYRAHLDLNSAMTADTDLIDAPGSDTDLVVYASSGAKTVTSFSATISLVSTASKVYVVRKQGATTVRSWLNNGDEVPAGTDVELVWKAYSGWTYNLQVETTTSGSLIVCEVSNAVSVAGLRRSGGGGGLSSVSTTGDALSGAGTSGDPLSAAAVLEALVDGGGTATAGAGTVLDLTTTGGLAFGTSSNDVRLTKDATNRMLLSRAGTTPADLRLSGLVVGTADTSGVRLEVNGGTLSAREGDDSARAPFDAYTLTAESAFSAPAGAVNAVSYRINSDTDTGFYGTANTSISAAIAGNEYLRVTSNGVGVFNGGVGAVMAVLAGSSSANYGGLRLYPSSGVYWSTGDATGSTDDLGISRAAAGVLLVQDGSGTGAALRVGAGSASAVSLGINADANTGFYGTADTSISGAIDGTRYLNLTTAGLGVNGRLFSEGGGTAASVVLGLDNSSSNGFYGNANADLGVSVGGKARHSWGMTRTLTDASATTVCTVGLASGEAVGVLIDYTITATSGSDIQVRTGRVIVPIRDASGTATGTATDDSQAEVSTGTLTASWTVADGTNAAVIQCNADSSLSTPTVTVHYEIALTGANPTLTLP